MYKRGMSDTLGPVFEHATNFVQFYQSFTHQHAYFRMVLSKQAEHPKATLEDYRAEKLKHFGQFMDDVKPLLIS